MEDVQFFLKFSKREYLSQFDNQALYFSNAKTLRGIESKNRIKGQGDILEGATRIFATRATMQDSETGRNVFSVPNAPIYMTMEPADNIPVFCLFAVLSKDCIVDEAGNRIIKLSHETKEVIREHFPDANAVAVIDNPDGFINDVKASIGCRAECDLVRYFNIDNGFPDPNGGLPHMDMEYMKFLIPELASHDFSKPGTFSMTVDQVYRYLFCKDVFFSGEQEYRIVLPDKEIDQGTTFPVQVTTKVSVFDLDVFFTDH